MTDQVNEPVAWMIGNPDGTVNPIGAIYHHRENCQQHIDGYGGKLAASIIPLYAHPARGVVDDWTPAGNGDYDRSIHANPSAEAWADLFVATFPGLADKHDLMRGWFANAMMAMHDHLHHKLQAAQPAVPSVPEGWVKAAPTRPGVYAVRGWHVGFPDDTAVCVVAEHDGELCCNLHERNSELDVEDWDTIAGWSAKFEWRYLAATPKDQPVQGVG